MAGGLAGEGEKGGGRTADVTYVGDGREDMTVALALALDLYSDMNRYRLQFSPNECIVNEFILHFHGSFFN